MEVAAMAVQMKSCSGGYDRKTMEMRWIGRRDYEIRGLSKFKSRRIPIFISTNPSDINPQELRELYSLCNHSCHRFPEVDHNGKVVEAVDLKKLRVALSHSSILVSVFCNLRDVVENKDRESKEEDFPVSPLMGLGDLLRTMTPLPVVSPSNAQLVGFGRAVSDFGLTASIYDVMEFVWRD